MLNSTRASKIGGDVIKKNPQLLLELEMDDEVNEIINFPEKHQDTYLDVTIIKPKDKTEKKLMSPEQVKEFVAAINLGEKYAKGDHKKILNNEENVQQVFNTTELGAVFRCKQRPETLEEKRSPCVCRNCNIVGLITESQKRPFATEPINKKKLIQEENTRRKKEEDHQHQHCQYYFKHLSEKIRTLEQRIAAQEQKAVPKEYFKKIITKLLNHFTKTIYGDQIKIEKPKPIPRQNFIVNPLVVEEEEPPTGLWKLKEDILKPGIDLKNKLISVMEDTLNSLKKSREKPKEEELKIFINEFSNNLYKTINDEKDKKRNGHRNRENLGEPVSVTYVNSRILKWQDTQTTFKFDSDKESVNNVCEKKRTQEIHKFEFFKIIKNTKDEDKRRLWESIWEQASKNGHNKCNKVTVQIPDKSKKMCVEVEYTLGDLEYLLLGNRAGRK